MPARVKKIAPSCPLGANLPFNSRLRYRFRDAGIGQVNRDAVPALRAAALRARPAQLPLPKRHSVPQLVQTKVAELAPPKLRSDSPSSAFPDSLAQSHRRSALPVAPRFSTRAAAFHPR